MKYTMYFAGLIACFFSIDSSIQIPPAIALQIKNQVFHSFLLQPGQRFLELLMGSGGKTVDTNITDLIFNHIGSIQAVNRYFIPFHRKGEQFLHPSAKYFQIHF